MPRARNVKPAIMADDVLATLGPFTRLLQIAYLPMLADREGRLEDRPKKIWGEAFPFDKELDIEKMLTELFDNGYIDRYSFGSKKYIQLLNFSDTQKPHGTEKDSQIPDRSGALTIHERTSKGYLTGKVNLVSALTVNQQSITSATQVNSPTTHPLIPEHGFLNPDLLIPKTRTEIVDNFEAVRVVLLEHEIHCVNVKDTRFQGLVSQDSTITLWAEAANIARRKSKPTFEYVMGIVGNKLLDRSEKQLCSPTAPTNATPREQMEQRAANVGIGKWNEAGPLEFEHWPAYCARVTAAELAQKACQR